MKVNIYRILALMFFIGTLSGCGNNRDDYTIEHLDTRFDSPHRMNVLFRLMTTEGEGVHDLVIEDFLIFEDDDLIGLESDAKIAHHSKIETSIQTFLLIDNSKSMSDKLKDLKESAIALISNSPEYQKFAVYVFSSSIEQVQSLTNDKKLLESRINSISIGTSSTNLYGALSDLGKKVKSYPNIQTLDEIKITNMICFSDGDDTQGTVPVSEAINALKEINAYLIGTGEDLNTSALSQLGEFYQLEGIDQLTDMFNDIQTKIQNKANSYYWLLYQSPKRGDFWRKLNISIKGEPDTFIEVDFNSKDFTD